MQKAAAASIGIGHAVRDRHDVRIGLIVSCPKRSCSSVFLRRPVNEALDVRIAFERDVVGPIGWLDIPDKVLPRSRSATSMYA